MDSCQKMMKVTKCMEMTSHFAKMVVTKMLTTMVEIPKSLGVALKKKGEKKQSGKISHKVLKH